MFRLRDLKNGLYQIHKTGLKEGYEGTPLSIFGKALKLGIPQRDLLIAVEELKKNQHDYADFNDYGRFSNTKKDR